MQLYAVQPLDRPTGRVFFIVRQRDTNGTTDGQVEQRAGWSYRSWANDPGEAQTITNGVTFSITSSDVTATGHKLVGKTSIEVEQDLRAYFGMDAVALISDVATDELAIELDEILVYNLYRQGSVNGVGTFQYGSTSLGATMPTSMTQEAWDKRLYELTSRAATSVLNQKRVYPNWILGGTEFQIHYGNISMWRTNIPELPLRTIVQPAGTVLDQFNLYIATMPFPTAEAIMGFKGRDYVDASAFYLPYIPLQLTGALFDPETQTRKLSWLTRYALYNHAFSGQKQSYAYLN